MRKLLSQNMSILSSLIFIMIIGSRNINEILRFGSKTSLLRIKLQK
jgi:hypothetical protein